MKWTMRTEPTGNALTDAHAFAFQTVKHLYHEQNPCLTNTYAKRAEHLESQFSELHRRELVATLGDYLTTLGAPEPSFRQLNRLLDPKSVAVVTGQQAGLFTGPLYSLYKALTAIGLANRLEKDLSRPVIPIFWVASEDHDWAEVNHAYVLDHEDNVRRLKLNEAPHPHQMVYATRLTQDSVESVIREASLALGDAPCKSDMLKQLHACWREGDSLATWFARILVHLTKNHGLVMLDPCLPGLRGLVRPVWATAIRNHAQVQNHLAKAYAEVEQSGFPPGVQRDETNTTLFYVVDGKRYVLERLDDDHLRVRGLGIEKSVDELIVEAEQSPTSFSSNVLLRPVVQDCLIPTLAYVGGPAEVAYFALARGVFEAHGRTMPPVLHRQRMTLYPGSVLRNMEKWNITTNDLTVMPRLEEKVANRLGADQIRDTFGKFRDEVAIRWSEWSAQLDDLGPQIRDMAGFQVRREVAALNRLEGKTLAVFQQRHDAELQQLRHVERWIWTDGHPQERRLSPLTAWAKFGCEWMAELPTWGNYDKPCPVYDVEL